MFGLTLLQRMHDLKTLDCGVSCFAGFKAERGFYQPLQLPMIGLYHVVQIVNLAMPVSVGHLPSALSAFPGKVFAVFVLRVGER